MYNVVHTVPSIEEEQITKTLAFPYQLGATGFPAMSKTRNNVYTKIYSLLTTARGERVMNYDLGVNLHEFVFSNMTPIQRARLANLIANAIETFVAGVTVNAVTSEKLEYQEGLGTMVRFDIKYTVGGESLSQQVIYTPTSKGS